MTWFILLLIIAVGGFLGYRQLQARSEEHIPHRPPKQKAQAAIVFRAVELQPCTHPCEVAIAIAGKRFLAGEAPVLPLPGCRRSHCRCSYKKFDDRRASQRRDTSLYNVAAAKVREEGNRRVNIGRRATDRRRG
jgi:hypothetical protein